MTSRALHIKRKLCKESSDNVKPKKRFFSRFYNIKIIIIIIIGIYIAPFPFIKCSKALHIVIV